MLGIQKRGYFNHRQLLGLGFLIFGFVFLVSSSRAHAQVAEEIIPPLVGEVVVPVVEPVIVPILPPEPAQMTLLQAVAKAHGILGEQLIKWQAAGSDHKTLKAPPKSIEVLLALWKEGTNDIRLVSGKKSGTTFTLTTENAPAIIISRNSGTNSAFRAADGSFVVGVIIPSIEEKVISKKVSEYLLTDVLKVPVTDLLYRPDILTAGSDYLSFLIKEAFDDIRARGAVSRAFPEKLLADVIDPYLVKSIVVIEQCDSRIYSDTEPERAVGAFLANLAVNKTDAFHGIESGAGALGLAQFIPSTYKLIVKARPELGLIPDFAAGMADHKNAIKAQIALLDSDLSNMPDHILALYRADVSRGGIYMAAAYNGGGARVRKAVAAWGDDWASPHYLELAKLQSRAAQLKKDIASYKKQITKATTKTAPALKKKLKAAETERANAVARIPTLQSASLRKETVLYVEKLKTVYGMFTGGWFATPSAPSGALPTVL